MRAVLLGSLLAFASAWAEARTIKVATWNLDWLTLRHAGDPELPDDVGGREPSDFTVLAGYATKLDADVVAIEEVDGPVPAGMLFPPARYHVLMTADDVVQRVGLAVRDGIVVERHPDVTGLDVESTARHRLRSGLDATLVLDGTRLRVLAVHLKSGCWSPREEREGRPACGDLMRQVPVLSTWMAARRSEGVPFLVLGDFNRRLVEGDRVLAALNDAAPLTSATWGLSSPCWEGEDFIDQILAGNDARNWMEAGSLRVLTYRGADPARKDHLSDHCPVSVLLTLPGASIGTGTAADR